MVNCSLAHSFCWPSKFVCIPYKTWLKNVAQLHTMDNSYSISVASAYWGAWKLDFRKKKSHTCTAFAGPTSEKNHLWQLPGKNKRIRCKSADTCFSARYSALRNGFITIASKAERSYSKRLFGYAISLVHSLVSFGEFNRKKSSAIIGNSRVEPWKWRADFATWNNSRTQLSIANHWQNARIFGPWE